MSMYLDLIEQFSEKIIKQLFLISSKGKTDQSFQDNSEKLIENLKGILNKLNEEKSENNKLEDELRDLDSDLFKVQIQFEDVNKKFKNSHTKTDEIISTINNLEENFDKINRELLKNKEELRELKSELKKIESSISAKVSEKDVLEQKRKDNEEKYKNALLVHSKKLKEFKAENEKNLEELESMCLRKIEETKNEWLKKFEDLENQHNEFMRNHFFTIFLIENSDESIPEFEVIQTLIEKPNCNLDDLKNQIDLPPILALRTIKQMQVKDILKINEQNNTVSLSEQLRNI